MSRLKATVIKLALGSAVILGGCAVVPADGYYYGGYSTYGVAPYGERYVTSDGVSVVYDYDPGVYRVVSYPGLFWWNGYYYRERGGHWERSHRHNGPWAHRPVERLPTPLRRGYDRHYRPPPHHADRNRYLPSYRAQPNRGHVKNPRPSAGWNRDLAIDRRPDADRSRAPKASSRWQPERGSALPDTHARPDWRRTQQGRDHGVPARSPADRRKGSHPREQSQPKVTPSPAQARVERSWARVRNQSKHVSRPPDQASKNDRYRHRFLQGQ
ncbi:MAG: hypothetical protein WCA32_20045 [Chromatiaceae bacterium]